MKSFETELRIILNIHGKDGTSATPDYILSHFMNCCLNAFSEAVKRRDAHEKGGMWPVELPPKNRLTGPADLPVYRNPPPEGGFIKVHPRLEPGASPLERSKFGGVWANDEPPRYPWAGRNVSYKGVGGHKPECEIDLDVNYHACTCEAG